MSRTANDEHDPTRGDLSADPEARADLQRMADEAADATWARADRAAPRNVPGLGLLSGDIGPKGNISANLRRQSIQSRAVGEQVPFGTSAPGSGRYVLGAFLAMGVALLGIVMLVVWLLS